MNSNEIPSKDLANLVVKGMQDKKAKDIQLIDFKNTSNSVADFFVIASGNSDTQVEAIADAIEEKVLKTTNENPWQKEGNNNNEWVLLDYVSVVAHVFLKDKRSYYSLEQLWGDADIKYIEDLE